MFFLLFPGAGPWHLPVLVHRVFQRAEELLRNNEKLDLLDYDENRERSLKWKTKRGYFQIKSSPLLLPLRGGQSCSSIVKIWGMNPPDQVCWQNVEAARHAAHYAL